VESELSRLVELSDVGGLLAERVALRARVRELEAQGGHLALQQQQQQSSAAALALEVEMGQSERALLVSALESSQRKARRALECKAELEQDVEALRARGEDAERRAWQLQALMASNATAASGVVQDWVGGADRLRAQRAAFFNEQLEEARERADRAEAALAAANHAWQERLNNETLALRLQGEAVEQSASGRLSVLGLQLRGEIERGEELEDRLGRCEAALRDALRRAATAEEGLSSSAVRIGYLEAELAALQGLKGQNGELLGHLETREALVTAIEAKLAASLSSLLAAERRAEEAEALLQEAQQKTFEAEALAAASRERAESLERLLVEAPRPLAAAAPAPVEHSPKASVDNPLLPKGFHSVRAFLDYLRSPLIGMRASQLVIFLDCTRSNELNTNKSYLTKEGKQRCLHDVSDKYDPNPYYKVIQVLGKHLEEFDDDKEIPLYGFGCNVSRDKYVFPYSDYEALKAADKAGKAGEKEKERLLAKDAEPCQGIEGVLQLYAAAQPNVRLQGPTSIAPAIDKTIRIVEETGEFTICLIVADGCLDTKQALEASKVAVARASKYPISIILVGVGDGEPLKKGAEGGGGDGDDDRWSQMNHFDDTLGDEHPREFDNFHFVEHKCVAAPLLPPPPLFCATRTALPHTFAPLTPLDPHSLLAALSALWQGKLASRRMSALPLWPSQKSLSSTGKLWKRGY
jgi:hypothetical protein